MNAAILQRYTNGGTTVTMLTDGTKIREFNSDLAPVQPESIDVKITDWCDAACKWCHEKSTKNGKHADLSKALEILDGLQPGTELAIGGGHPLSHPNVDDFLKELHSRGIICNLTINEFHFESELKRIERFVSDGLVKGIGYSYTKKPSTWAYEHLINHVIIGITSPLELKELAKVNSKVLLLGYKTYGRGKNYSARFPKEVHDNVSFWYRYLFKAAQEAFLSFDNLAINQLNPKRLFKDSDTYNKFYMGDDGKFTMYVDAVEQQYALSSTSYNKQPYIGKIKDMFCDVRNNH